MEHPDYYTDEQLDDAKAILARQCVRKKNHQP
jgi:hypothetical protein